MARDSFTAFVLEQLLGVGQVLCKPMFSSYGLYLNGNFFAIVNNGALYFKTNEQTKKSYLAYGMKPFAPSPDQVLKNYYEVPADVVEDSVALHEWALMAAQVAAE
jgi:DNA transformation protein